MRYGSVSSGIECAAIAWAPLGWTPAFLAEIDPFASTVLHHHHSSGRPRHMPSPDAEGLTEKQRRARRAAIKAVAALPERANGVPNFGDMTTFEEWPDADIDVLVGGTPCQSYSVAGLRAGLDDPRGDLTLTYAAIARRYRPRWVVWENVFGVLSHDAGRSFASLLGLLSGRRVEVPGAGWKSAGIVEGYERAYGLAWRVLDTQYVRVDGFGRAIPQRRRRVFVVGYLGDWRRAAAVLLERQGLSGDPAPRRGTAEDLAGTLAGGARGRGGFSADDIPHVAEAFGGNRTSGPIDVATALTAHGGPAGRLDFESETFVATAPVAPALAARAPFGDHESREGLFVAHSLTAGMSKSGARMPHEQGALVPIAFDCKAGGDTGFSIGEVPGALRGEGHGGGHAAVALPLPFDTTQITNPHNRSRPEPGDPCHPLSAQAHPPAIAYGIDSDALDRSGEGSGGTAGERAGLGITEEHTNALRAKRPGAVAFQVSESGVRLSDVHATLDANNGPRRHNGVISGWAVRRLTPRECCRLQGVPDDYFDEVVWRGKSPPPDGPVYKTLGNGFSANAVRWIGRRIEMVEQLLREVAA